MKKTYQVSKKLYRIAFGFMMGILFTYLNLANEEMRGVLNLYTYTLGLIAYYYLLDFIEEYQFTGPINRMLRQGNQNVEEAEK